MNWKFESHRSMFCLCCCQLILVVQLLRRTDRTDRGMVGLGMGAGASKGVRIGLFVMLNVMMLCYNDLHCRFNVIFVTLHLSPRLIESLGFDEVNVVIDNLFLVFSFGIK